MNIGIDIDGVLNDEKQFCLDYGTGFCVSNHFRYCINLEGWRTQDIMQWDSLAETRFWTKYYLYYIERNEYVRAFASQTVCKLKDEGHRIIIISARDPESRYLAGNSLEKLTITWLSQNKIPFDSICFGIDKKALASQYHIDIMIEDNPDYIQQIAHDIPVLCFHGEHNKKIVGSNVKRVFSWNEVYRYIYIMKGNAYD